MKRPPKEDEGLTWPFCFVDNSEDYDDLTELQDEERRYEEKNK
jgi:hypothetical protein